MSKPIITVVGSFAVGLTIRTCTCRCLAKPCWATILTWGRAAGSNQAVGVARWGRSLFCRHHRRDKLGEIAAELYAQREKEWTPPPLCHTRQLATASAL
jgi:ribokinase